MQELAQFIANHLALTYLLAIILLALMVLEFLRTKRNQCTLDTTKAIQLINRENATVVDIRSSEQYKKGHIIDSQLIASSELMSNTKAFEKLKKRPLIIVCATGFDSQKMAAFLLRQGYNAYSLSGGIRSWSDAELPLVKE